jgi:hypothetical protein
MYNFIKETESKTCLYGLVFTGNWHKNLSIDISYYKESGIIRIWCHTDGSLSGKYSYENEYANMESMSIYLDNGKNCISKKLLVPHREIDYSGRYIETACCEISQQELKYLADASNVEVRVISRLDFQHDECNKLSSIARELYNVVFDPNAYIAEIQEDIEKERKEKIEESEKKRKVEIEQENRKIDDKFSYAYGIISALGFCATLIIGGIWSLCIDSWRPLLIFLFCTVGLLLLVLFIHIPLRKRD